MPYIRVDHSRFEAAAKQMEDYLAFTKSKMLFANASANHLLSSGWKGNDAGAFRSKWSEIIGNGSTYMKMMKSLKSYADYLRYAASCYKQAQADAVNRARRIH